MLSVVASHGPGSNPRGNAICNAILLQSFPVLQIFGLQYLDRHRPPSSDVLPLNLAQKLKISKSIKTGPISHTGPKTSRAARDRPEPDPRINQPSRHRRSFAEVAAGRRPPPTKICGGSARPAPSATHGRAQQLAHRAAITPQASTSKLHFIRPWRSSSSATTIGHRATSGAQCPASTHNFIAHHRATGARRSGGRGARAADLHVRRAAHSNAHAAPDVAQPVRTTDGQRPANRLLFAQPCARNRALV
ncbi:putative sugar phosphate/phosphate translocator [Dorcoceras hygrometricum]|uniref:Putative sugar phosphate/phosphate translocator n=1 Tax=Dorcoceras hygrometricum TaxID=472368 RepID=A0A2Z7CGC6_9LAMI|nr:putative sugar phosphate/phosphate translocator [Dorcoceras hygrometricum]